MLSYRIRNKWDDPELLVSWFHETADEVAKLERVARAANAVIDDWPDTIYGDDDPEINHWVILHKLKVALADLDALGG